MNKCRFDILPVELIHHLLSHFSAHEIFYTFTNISSYLDAVLFTYSCYQINFQSIAKKNFDLIYQHIIPNQVISLILCNDEHTPGLVELFLSRFQINQFIHLQSLRLIEIAPDCWNSVMTKLIELKNLRSFSFIASNRSDSWISNISEDDITLLDMHLSDVYAPILPQLYRLRLCHGDFLKSIQFPQLHHLILERSTIDIVKHICSVSPQLKSLETSFLYDESSTELIYPSIQLNRLVLDMRGSYVSMNDLERMLSNLPHLKHLELVANCNNDVVNGQRWQMKMKDFLTFKFRFNLLVRLESNDLDSFRSSFWLEEKRWFVAYTHRRLFSVPYFNEKATDENFRPPIYSTVTDNKIFYECINELELSEINVNKSHYFTHVQTLTLSDPTFLLTVEKIVNLNRVQHLSLNVSMGNLPIMDFINRMPSLHKISIRSSVRNFLRQVHYKRIERIRTLEIGDIFINTRNYTIEKLCSVFPNIEYLHVDHTCSIIQIFDFLHRFKHLSTATFRYTPWTANGERKQQSRLKIQFALDRVRRLQRFNYTYRFDCSSVHIWI